MGRSIKAIFADIHAKDTKAEGLVKRWLEQKKAFKVLYWHQGKRSNKPYDMLALKNKRRWAIEVKTGAAPPIKLGNFQKLLEMRKIDMIGLVLVVNDYPYLLSYNKRTWRGEKAWSRKRKNQEWWSREHGIRARKTE